VAAPDSSRDQRKSWVRNGFQAAARTALSWHPSGIPRGAPSEDQPGLAQASQSARATSASEPRTRRVAPELSVLVTLGLVLPRQGNISVASLLHTLGYRKSLRKSADRRAPQGRGQPCGSGRRRLMWGTN